MVSRRLPGTVRCAHFPNQGLAEFRIGIRFAQLAGMRDIHGHFGRDKADVGGRPGKVPVHAHAGSAHAEIARAISLAQYYRYFGHGGRAERDPLGGDASGHSPLLRLAADKEAGRVAQEDKRNVEGVAQDDEAGDLVRAIETHRAAIAERIIGNDADRVTVKPRQRRDDAAIEQRFQFQEPAVVEEDA